MRAPIRCARRRPPEPDDRILVSDLLTFAESIVITRRREPWRGFRPWARWFIARMNQAASLDSIIRRCDPSLLTHISSATTWRVARVRARRSIGPIMRPRVFLRRRRGCRPVRNTRSILELEHGCRRRKTLHQQSRLLPVDTLKARRWSIPRVLVLGATSNAGRSGTRHLMRGSPTARLARAATPRSYPQVTNVTSSSRGLVDPEIPLIAFQKDLSMLCALCVLALIVGL